MRESSADKPPLVTRAARAIRRWRVPLTIWMAQALISWAALFAWTVVSTDVDGRTGKLFGPLTIAVVRSVLSSGDAWSLWGIALSSVTFCQAAMLWPVRRPCPNASRGWPLRWSMAAAAVGAIALLAAFAALVFTVTVLADPHANLPWIDDVGWKGFVVFLSVCWCVATPLLLRFARRRLDAGDSHEDVLGRISAGLFLGTVVEAVAIIPVDVMFRRKTDCYCGPLTFGAMVMCGSVGMLAFGPAVFLPLLSRRRKRWYAGRCDCCGYDMTGLLATTRVIDRCPECGAGWRYEPSAGAEEPRAGI